MTTRNLSDRPKRERKLAARVDEDFFDEAVTYCDAVGIDASSLVRMAVKAYLKSQQVTSN